MMILSTCIAACLAGGQGPGFTAIVDDPHSHGFVGDSLLSLDEAIRLANGTLLLSNLSTAEQARVATTSATTEIIVDAANTPVITIQAPLTSLTGLAGSTSIVRVTGIPTASTLPILDGGTQSAIVSLSTRFAMIYGFRFENGGIAIDAKMAPSGPPAMQMAMVSNCEFEGQTSSAIRLLGTGNDSTKMMVRDCSMRNMPVGFRMDDQTANGTLMSDNERITMDGVTLGCSFFAGGSGQVSMWSIWRSSFVNGETLAKSTRAPTATQLMMLRIVYTDATCSGDVVDMEGTSAGTSMVHHHHSDWVAGPNKHCLLTHPRTAQFDVHGSEMSFDGDILMAGGTTSPRFWHQNNEYKNGTITFDIEGALPNLVWNRYENCSINVPTLARSPVVIRDSQFIGTNIDSQSFLAPANLSGCYRSGSALSGFTNETDNAPVPFLGTTEVTPREPRVGDNLHLSADLPSGISLVWDIAESYSRPTTSTEPVRFYGDPTLAVLLPIVVIFQSTITVPIPTTPALAGLEFYAQGIAIPWTTMTHAPAYQLPRGGRIYIQP